MARVLTPEQAAAELLAIKKQLIGSIPAVVGRGQHHLATQVKARMSGRPGPIARTGDLRRSVTVQPVQVSSGGRVVIGAVTSNAPQARRLEFGFVGTDSLGRVYDQLPYPAWAPALAEFDRWFGLELEQLL